MSGDCNECGSYPAPDGTCRGPLDRCLSVRAKDGYQWCELNDIHPDGTEGNYASQAFEDGKVCGYREGFEAGRAQLYAEIEEIMSRERRGGS